MESIELYRTADDSLRAHVTALVSAIEAADGIRFLSDHLWLDLQDESADEERGFLASLVRNGDGALVAYAQASPSNSGYVIESGCHPDRRDDDELELQVLRRLLDEIAGATGGDVTWWVHDVADRHDVLAYALGLAATRGLYQMRRPLPTGIAVEVTTRSFDPARDEAEWIAVNNRAFAEHGEQGGWDLATLRQRERESWFDPDGFRIHERDGRLAAFCWTKLHPPSGADPALGEIYVIGVDPDFQRLGLGRQLTLAGLESIADRGVDIGMLYVDAGNTPAVEMYRALDFTIHRSDRAYTTTLGQGA